MFYRVLGFIVSLFFVLLSPVLPCWASIDYGKQTLIGEDFSNSDLKGATFYLTNLQDANLSGSDLEGASLFGAKLLDTNLSNANLKNATLDSAVFNGTDLTNAVLEDAFVFNARFKDVTIIGTDFTNVIFREDDLRYLCSEAKGQNPVTNRLTKDTLICDEL